MIERITVRRTKYHKHKSVVVSKAARQPHPKGEGITTFDDKLG